jgi:hypothetical protein
MNEESSPFPEVDRVTSINRESDNETVRKPHCLFLSPAMGTDAGLRGVKVELGKNYGPDKVTVFNSVLSPDPQNPNRFEQMADIIQTHAKEGLDIVAHSVGAAELRRAIKKVTERDSAFFDKEENRENLQIFLVSPSGFNKGILGALKYLGRTFKFNREQGNWPIFSKSKSLYRGIDALTAFPPEGITSSDLAQAMQKAMPKQSQYREGIEKIPLEEERNNISRLSQNQKEILTIYSKKMQKAIEQKNYAEFRGIVAEYGKIFFSTLNDIYAGEFESARSEGLEAAKATMGAYIGSIRTLINSLGSTPMKEIAGLHKKGVSVNFVVPEYDIYVKLDQAIAFFEGSKKASQRIRMALGTTHMFPELQPMRFGALMKNLQWG